MATAVATHHELWEIKGEKSWLHMHPGQLKAWDSKKRWILVLAGCVAGETLIDIPGGEPTRIDRLATKGEPIRVWSVRQGELITAVASAPFLKGRADLYKLRTQSGREVIATLDHKMLALRNGHSVWLSVGEIRATSCHVACAPLQEFSWDKVVSVDYIRTDDYYDMSVPRHENYVAQGLVHHNSQSGKTSWGPLWLNREIIEKGPGDYLGVTATFPLLKLKMLPELQKCFETYLRIATYVASDHIFKSNEKLHGAEAWRIILGSASNAESLESATAKAAWCDEAGQKAFSLSAWEAVRRRLALNRGRALMTTTPYGLGWLKSEFYDKAMAGDPDIELIQFDSTLNPAFPKEEFEQRRAEMPLWKFNMFYRGMFERPVGLIYDAFDESVCKVKRFPIPEAWPCYVGHDFGGANPAAMFYRVDPTTGYIYAWQEYRPREGRSIYQHVEQFKKITTGISVFKRAGGSHQEDEIRQGYTAHGWPISEPKFHGSASVEAGIAAVYALHKRNKLFIFDDLVNYLDEKSTYSRKLDANFMPTDEIDNKSDYHLLDCERSILSDFTPDTVTGNRARTKRSSFAF